MRRFEQWRTLFHGQVVIILPKRKIGFELKEEYASRLIEEGSNVEIGVKGKKTVFNVDEVDWKTGERTLGEKAKKKVRDRIDEDLQISVLASGSSWINVPTGSIFWTITKKMF